MSRPKKSDKKMVAMRLSGVARDMQAKLAARTGKTQTRVTEEALLLHGKTLGVGVRIIVDDGKDPK